mgnify:CR=1 FL=1
MEQKKIPFFKKLKNAIVNFDEYQNFSQEKLGTAIKYFLKLMLIFSILISAFLTARLYKEIETVKTSFTDECPDFRIENNTLIIDGENKKYEKDFGYEALGLIIDSENTDLTEEQNGQYQRIIAFYKDKMVMKTLDTKTSMTYEDISKNQNINGLSKQQILDYTNSSTMILIYITFFVITIVFGLIAYSIQILLDIFLLSIIGLIMSKIAAVKLKYKEIFNMSIYALTLSIVLYLIYICVNITTGFTIKYFDLAYEIISYIYIITAILMIKSDLIKQQIEIGKIVEEQKKVREEKKQEDNEEEKPKEDKEEKKEKKDKEEKVYNEDYFHNIDSYDIFLAGATPVLKITNNKVADKKLIVFRDSYGSSIIPFLAENYHEVIVLDLRYVKFANLQNLDIDLTNPDDILFIYSVNIINNSFSLK